MKLLLTFLMATGLSLPVFAQNAANESVDSNGTQQYMGSEHMGSEGASHNSTEHSVDPQSEEVIETESIEKNTDLTRPDGSTIQEEVETEETMKTDAIPKEENKDTETTTP